MMQLTGGVAEGEVAGPLHVRLHEVGVEAVGIDPIGGWKGVAAADARLKITYRVRMR